MGEGGNSSTSGRILITIRTLLLAFTHCKKLLYNVES